MHGNVYEWTADWWSHLTANPVVDPIGPATGSARVGRGGSWDYAGPSLLSAGRSNLLPSNRWVSIGFRVGFQKQ